MLALVIEQSPILSHDTLLNFNIFIIDQSPIVIKSGHRNL